jgi:hypothetical protein
MLFTLLLAQAVATAPAKPASDPNKLVCRSVMEAGSRIPSRICRSQGEWEQMAKDAQDEINRSANARQDPGGAVNPH